MCVCVCVCVCVLVPVIRGEPNPIIAEAWVSVPLFPDRESAMKREGPLPQESGSRFVLLVDTIIYYAMGYHMI